MNRTITVLAFERTKATSDNDADEFIHLLNILEKKYHFKWCQTLNSSFLRKVADDVDKMVDDFRKTGRD